MKRLVFALGLLFAAGAAALGAAGVTMLPTAWSIRANDGPVATVGTLPVGLVLSRDGSRVIELDGGHHKPALHVLDAATLREIRSVSLGGGYGAPLGDENGDGVWVAVTGTFQESIAHVDTSTGTVDKTVSLPNPFYPAALARARNGRIAVAGDLANRVVEIDPTARRIVAEHDVGHHPAALVYAPNGTLYVANRGSTSVDAIGAKRARIFVGLHPSALASDGRFVYAAVGDDDLVAVIDPATNRVVQRVRIPFARADAVGTSPNALALAGDRLYVSCGAANAVAVFRTGPRGLTALGAIPAGWYPTAVAIDRAHGALYVANGLGESSHPNPSHKPNVQGAGFVLENVVGSVRRIAIPNDASLAQGLAEVRRLAQHELLPDDPVVRRNGPIRHVIYVIKENRTYDQILGDVAGGDGDPSLTLYGEKVTPNQHALAKRFGLFDRFFVNSLVSPDGHNWSTAAFANDYVEKMVPANSADRRSVYDFEDGAEAAVPHAGYLWDDAARHGIRFRNYGEFVTAGPSGPTPVSAMNPTLDRNTDRDFATYDMSVEDMTRFAEWKREFDAYESSRTLPPLEIVRFPRDHTSATRAGSVTPQGMVADNDLAVGKLVEDLYPDGRADRLEEVIQRNLDDEGRPAVAEDETGDQAPEVLHRWGGVIRRLRAHPRYVQDAMYTQASVLRTIEVILGLPPMSAYDAGAAPLTAAFTVTPNAAPFDALPAQVDVKAKNASTAYRAADSARLDFSRADAADPATVNDILWHSAKGSHAAPPPPPAAFAASH